MSRRFVSDERANRLASALCLFAIGVGCPLACAACGTGDSSSGPTDAGPDVVTTVGNTIEAGPTTTVGTLAPPKAVFSDKAIDFGFLSCGAPTATKAVAISNTGPTTLSVSANTAGKGFSVSPSTLTVRPGGNASLLVSVNVPRTATAGNDVLGALNVFTSDPTQATVTLSLKATPSGATIVFPSGLQPSLSFPSTEVGNPAAPIPFTIANTGNASASVTIAPPGNPQFSLSVHGAPDAGSVSLAAGAMLAATVDFTPTNTTPVTATSAVTIAGVTCGASLDKISFSGTGAYGSVTGWPATLDFGPANCGGVAPARQTFQLLNSSGVDVHVTQVAVSAGFTSSISVGDLIPGANASVPVRVFAPAVPRESPVTPVTGTLTVATDAAGDTPHVVALTEEPSGAILGFDTSPTPGFGNFGQVVLLQSTTQNFNVTNTGSAQAAVTLVAAANGAQDGGADAGVAQAMDATVSDAGIDATSPDATTANAGPPSPFSVSTPSFTSLPGRPQAEVAAFSPILANATSGSIQMLVSGPVCGAVPAPLAVTGVGIGGGPVVNPSSLSFLAPCGGAAPDPQAFLVTNGGNANFTWDLSSLTGPGAAQYAVKANPLPGLLLPGQSATITVTAAAIASPAPNPNPSELAASLTVTTDVPLDPPHVLSLTETPAGDQLYVSQSSLRFGQLPIGSTIVQGFTLTNGANAGSPSATLTFALQDTGASAYSVAPATIASLAAGASQNEHVTFAPTAGASDPATLSITTTDPLCAPLPAPIVLRGTGTQGAVSLSTSTLTFGTDPQDSQGLVNCGSTGPYQFFVVSNVGNQALHITGLSLGLGTKSAYTLSGAGASLPATLAIGGSTPITVTPQAIPALVANPNDPTPFTDTLTVTTDAAGDSPHLVHLVMQARGAVIADRPLPAHWDFGTIGVGAIGTLASAIQNTGNAPATVELDGLSQPTLFGLLNNPTTAPGGAVVSVVGQFTPPSADGSWTDRGSLVVKAPQSFCAPLPAAWAMPAISLSGSSNSTAPVSVSGSLAFPSTDCGNPAPSAQSVTLTNATNVPYPYTLKLASGTFYSIQSAGPGTVPSNGAATIVVAPNVVTPGPGVVPGDAPYADQLSIVLATTPTTTFNVPIAWRLNGAVLTLPSGRGTSTDAQGNAFYPADTASGFSLSMTNIGTATASVGVTIQPSNAFGFHPLPPWQVSPGIPTTVGLASGASAAACPMTTNGTASFQYSGPVCQPFPLPSVDVRACVGTMQ